MTAAELIERLKQVPPNALVVTGLEDEVGYYRYVSFIGPRLLRPSARDHFKGYFTTTNNKRRRRKAVILR